MPNQREQGTGRHPPGRRDTTEKVQKTAGPDRGDSSDLKSCEYRDKDGEIHHHTRTYERDHPGKSR
jgi:hypothetical protein